MSADDTLGFESGRRPIRCPDGQREVGLRYPESPDETANPLTHNLPVREHPVRTVCAAGAVLGVTLWNEVDGTRPLWMAFSVTPNIDAEDAASGGGQGAL